MTTAAWRGSTGAVRAVQYFFIVAMTWGAVACGSSGDRTPLAPFHVVASSIAHAPTRAAFGPDGRLWVTHLDGSLTAAELAPDGSLSGVVRYLGLSGREDAGCLGIAFSPRDDELSFDVYVAHAPIGSRSPDCSEPAWPFAGRVSRLRGPTFDVVESVLEGLPCTGRSHGVNGLAFGDDGALYVSVGGTTNAGVPTCAIGGVPESPVSSCILRVDPPFAPGARTLQYRDRATSLAVDDQLLAADADLDPTPGVSIFATGLRNALPLAFDRGGQLWTVDNGANSGEGEASRDATTSQAIPNQPDHLWLVPEGAYLGHPNRNRGRDAPRENVFGAAEAVDGTALVPAAALAPSTNGLVDYRSQARPELVGSWIVQQMSSATLVVPTRGEPVEPQPLDIELPALDLVAGPGGTLVGVDFIRDRIRVAVPIVSSSHPEPYDVFPDRGRSTGGQRAVVSGAGFPIDTEVRFGGVTVQIEQQSATRLVVRTPALPPGDHDVEVVASGTTMVLPMAWRSLP